MTARRTVLATTSRAAVAGAVAGALSGWIYGAFSPVTPLAADVLLAVYGTIHGAIAGGVIGVLAGYTGLASLRHFDSRQDLQGGTSAQAHVLPRARPREGWPVMWLHHWWRSARLPANMPEVRLLPAEEATQVAAGGGDEGGALNDWERRQLDLIEQRLAEQDPEFAHTLRMTAGSTAAVWTALAILLGVVALLGALVGDVSLLLVTGGCAVAAHGLRRHHLRGGRGAHRRGGGDGR